jgi:hypothetical protein
MIVTVVRRCDVAMTAHCVLGGLRRDHQPAQAVLVQRNEERKREREKDAQKDVPQ